MIYMYATEDCVYCKKAKALLEGQPLTVYEVKNSDDWAEMLQHLSSSFGVNPRTVPQIFTDKYIGGYEDLVNAQQKGLLDIN